MIPPLSALGAEWQIPGVGSIGGVGGVDPATAAGGSDGLALTGPAGTGPSGGFGGMLAQQIDNLSQLQDTAATASRSLADGTATDAASVVTAVEKAQLAMQLAGQIRTKGSEAINDIFHTQI
ncbi:MAG TPA: flagellar hook-basal body complex protein FliE [Conexibacter sp.]|nr:flagellar hook-basal body complex protein FliE [Conexibacter sp.]